MAIWLDTRGYSDIAIAICDRCRMKRPHAELSKDPNFPGLMVCEQGCKDEFDPYRLPARKTEKITIRFPRPDASVAANPSDLTAGSYAGAVISTQQNVDPNANNNDGNLDGLKVTPSSN